MRPIHVVPFAILLLTSACQDDDQNPAAPTPEVAAAAAAPAWRQVAAGELHTCGVTIDDKAYCWGHGANGWLGTECRPSA